MANIRVIIARRRTTLLRRRGGGLAGTGTAGQLATWATSGSLSGDAGLAWDGPHSELDLSGPGTGTGTLDATATAAGGVAVAAVATHASGGTGVSSAAGGTGGVGVQGTANGTSGHGVNGQATAATGIGVQGKTATGIALEAEADAAGGIGLHVTVLDGAGKPVVIDQPAGPTTPALLLNVNGVATGALSPTGKGGAYFNSAALVTTATGGFLGLPSFAGTPTGVPSGYPAGVIPAGVDTTAGKLWCYYGGTWHYTTLT